VDNRVPIVASDAEHTRPLAEEATVDEQPVGRSAPLR